MLDNISNSKNEFYDFMSLPHNPEELFELLYIIQKNERYEIYKAINNESREVYAIKIISLGDSTFFQKLKEETLIMKSLNKCENIVKYYGSYFCLKTKKIWLIYEYCPAGSVYDLMKAIDRPLIEHEISIIINDILKALAFMHQLNIVHNHIKLSNILITENAISKLSNFSYSFEISNNSLFFSKKNDKSIKQYGDPKYDICLLGIACIELFKGIKNNNFDSKQLLDLINNKDRYSTQKIIEKIFFDGSEQLCSKNFIDFIKRCIETNSNKRPTAFELKDHPFIKDNLNSTNSDMILFTNLVKYNIENVEFNKKEYNYKELPNIEQNRFSHLFSSINSNVNKSKITINKNNENEKNSILNFNTNDNNSYNVDKIAEFRIEQMKKDGEEEVDKYSNKDILVDNSNSNLDNTGFHYNSVDSRNNTLKQSAAFGKPILKNSLNNKTYVNGKQSLLLSKMMKEDNKEDSKINLYSNKNTNTLSDHSKALLKKESEDVDYKENWEHLNKYANIFKSDLSDANSNNNNNHSFLFLNVDDSFDIHINNKLIKNNNFENTISANNNNTISNHDNNSYNKPYKNIDTHIPFTQMKCTVIRLGSSVEKNKINRNPNVIFSLKNNSFKLNENNSEDIKEINNQKTEISFGNNAVNNIESNTKKNFSIKKSLKNEISNTTCYTSLNLPNPKNKVNLDNISENHKSCKPYFYLNQKLSDENAFLLINDDNYKNLKPKKTIKVSLNNSQNNYDQIRSSKRLSLYKYINENEIPKEKIINKEKSTIIKVKRLFNNKNLYSSKSSISLMKNSKTNLIKNKKY